ncbi:MAG: hypothetical protein ACFCBW_07310 [Candidatus Competibacterales bacterium]
MEETFIAYLQTPTLDNFLALRRTVMATPGFNPHSRALDGIPALLEANAFERAVQVTLDGLWPDYFLSPGAHLNLGFAYHQLGQQREAHMERMIYDLLLRGIEHTGDGSAAKPLLVSRLSDEYDYLGSRRLTFTGQRLVEIEGHPFDVLSVAEGEDIWFDIADLQGFLNLGDL